MQVLVCYEPTEKAITRRTMARLAAAFVFDLDVLTPQVDIEPWESLVAGEVQRTQSMGDLGQSIRAACERRHYDLVVVGLRERPGLLRLLLGSRVGRLIHAAPATIWIARGSEAPVRRIVLGVAGGPQTLLDADLAAILASVFDATVDLVHVVSQLPLLYAAPEELAAALTEGALTQIDPGLRSVRRAYGLLRARGVTGRIVLRLGVVLEELLAVCRGDQHQRPADLLMVGAHQVTHFKAPDYLADLAEEITQNAPLATLVIHAGEGWDVWRAAMRNREVEH